MPIIHIPPQSIRRWTGPYLGEFYGTLWKTFNIDLDRREGKISLSKRTLKVADTTDTNSDTLGTVMAFLRSNAGGTDRWWALSEKGPLYRCQGTDPNDSWDVDTIASSPTDARDFCVHEKDSNADTYATSNNAEDIMIVTRDSDVALLNDTATNAWALNWWVTNKSQAALDTGVPHPCEYFRQVRKTLIGSRNRIHTIDKDKNIVANRVVFPSWLQIEHIFTTRSRAWVLLSHTRGGEGGIGEWDGFSETYLNIYPVKSSAPLSGVGWNDIPIIVNNAGKVLEWNGNGFIPMIRDGEEISFPIDDDQKLDLTNLIRPRGMTVDENGLIYINVRGAADAFRYVSGIWCLNIEKGRLYNKFAFGDTDFGEQAINDVGAIQSLKSSNSARLFMVGGQNFSTSGINTAGIWTTELFSSTSPNRGYFITQWIAADSVKDFWDSVWVRFRRFMNANNRIIVKSRGVRPAMRQVTLSPLQGTITWTSTTTFTVTMGGSDDALAVGDEVEIMNGDNAGTLAHITTISGAHGALQTITIDETMDSGTSTSLARFDKWRKLAVISDTSKYEDIANIGIAGSFVQFKIELRGPAYQMEVESLIANYNTNIEKEK